MVEHTWVTGVLTLLMGQAPTWYPTWIFFGQVSNVELTYSFWFHLKVPFWDGLVRPLHLESFYGDIFDFGWNTWTFKLIEKNLQIQWVKAGGRSEYNDNLASQGCLHFFGVLGHLPSFSAAWQPAKKNKKMKMMKILGPVVGCWVFLA